ATKRVGFTFDIAWWPFARVGVYRTELKSICKMLGTRLTLPRDLLEPSREEQLICGAQVGVCLARIDFEHSAKPRPSLSFGARSSVRFQRAIQKSHSTV